MDEEQQNVFSQQGSSDNNTIGNNTEQEIIKILKECETIQNVWKDYSNSKFDIYFILNGETITRGLQVKAITKVKGKKDNFRMNHLDRYENGMLIVGMNIENNFGLAYIKTDSYDIITSTFSLGIKGNSRFKSIIMYGYNFRRQLYTLLTSAPIVTQEVFEKSITKDQLSEHNSISRFIALCVKFGFTNIKRVENSSSHTDLLLNGLKIQMKYAANQSSVTSKGTYSYKITLAKANGMKTKQPYRQGDNDFYIIELLPNHGDFLILSETLLIEKGYIQTINQKGKWNLDVYPYDYVEKKKATMTKNLSMVKGNWTCDRSLWILSNQSRDDFIGKIYFKNDNNNFQKLEEKDLENKSVELKPMPEAIELAFAAEELIKYLYRHNKWLNLVYIAKHSNAFPDINLETLSAALNKSIVDIFFKGKYNFIVLSDNVSIKVHFGMSGQWVINTYDKKQPTPSTIKPNNTHFELIFSDEETIVQVFFVNNRFGKFHVYTDHQTLCENVEKIANGFLGRFIITPQEWLFNFSLYTGAKLLREALLDQKQLCSGIGNYLRIEIFYYAKFHPDVTIGKLTEGMKLNLYHICLNVIQGHYQGTIDKVVYEKQYCPNGHLLTKEKRSGRPFYYCSVEQVIGL